MQLYTAADERDEARYVVREVSRLRRHGRRPGDMAVFYRTNAQSRALEDELVYQQIPYTIIGATKFYDRKEIKDLLAYLRVSANPLDTVSLKRIINTPTRGIGRTTVDALAATAAANGVALFELVYDPGPSGLPLAAANRVSRFGDMLQRLRGLRDGPVTALVQRVIDDTGYLGRLEDGTPEGTSRGENVREFITVTREFDATAGGSLPDFLEQIALVADVDTLTESSERLTLMTIHNSKGLEFPVVFLTGMEEGLFPHGRSTQEAGGAEEERRLCYVGMTRARERLYLLHAASRNLFGRRVANPPSRFLREIPDGCLARDSAEPREATTADEITIDYSYSQLPGAAQRGRSSSPRAWETQEIAGLRIGTQVRHAEFGVGTVRALEGRGERAKAVVQFTRGGIKKLMLRFAPLEIVSP